MEAKTRQELVKIYGKKRVRETSADRHNPIKRETRLKYENALNKKFNSDFDSYWNTAMTIARQQYGYTKDVNKLSQEASVIVRDAVLYEDSILDRYETERFLNPNAKVRSVFKSIESDIYESSTEDLLDAHGTFMFEYEGDEAMTLNKAMDLYKAREIDKWEMNKIIARYQEADPDYNRDSYKGKYGKNVDKK